MDCELITKIDTLEARLKSLTESYEKRGYLWTGWMDKQEKRIEASEERDRKILDEISELQKDVFVRLDNREEGKQEVRGEVGKSECSACKLLTKTELEQTLHDMLYDNDNGGYCMSKTKIEWTETTWNPVTGCSKISSGCKNCYAERMAKRLQAMGQNNYINGFDVTCHKHMLDIPLKLKKVNMIFVNSMSDLFHDKVPFTFIKEIFAVMRIADHHIYQILTKRAERLMELSPYIDWKSHMWMGVTVEDISQKHRIEKLKNTEAKVKFISFEPLLTPLGKLDLKGIDWVIVGGESGPFARKIEVEWVREIRNQCVENHIPFFFKQWGGLQKKKNGRKLDGITWSGMPTRELLAV